MGIVERSSLPYFSLKDLLYIPIRKFQQCLSISVPLTRSSTLNPMMTSTSLLSKAQKAEFSLFLELDIQAGCVKQFHHLACRSYFFINLRYYSIFVTLSKHIEFLTKMINPFEYVTYICNAPFLKREAYIEKNPNECICQCYQKICERQISSLKKRIHFVLSLSLNFW